MIKQAVSLYLAALGWKSTVVWNVDMTTHVELRHLWFPLRLKLI